MKKKVNNKGIKLLLVYLIIGFSYSCGGADDPEPVNEEELITTVNVTFTNTADANDVVIASFQDPDGPGGNDGTFINPTLTANSTYSIAVAFLNESVVPTDNITEEVEEEGEDHQVFYTASSQLQFDLSYTDHDVNNNPIGITASVVIGSAGTGKLDVVLVHLPNKLASGVSDGDITNAGGDEDIHISFDLTIQ